jgi:hypothetical protein
MVSSAEPGFMDTVKESYAGSKAFAKSPELRDLLKGGGMPQMPKGSQAEVEQTVLSALNESQVILQAKGPDELNGFREAVSSAVNEVANAAGGGAGPQESEAIGKIKAAIGA